MHPMLRGFLMVVGTLAVSLGVIGIFVPILPTTPFLLLGAYCYARSSDRFYRRLLSNRWFGPYIRNYREGGGMLLRDKALTLTALWLTIGSTVAFAVESPIGRGAMLLVACAVTVHLLHIPTLRVAVPEPSAPVPLGEPVFPDRE